MAWAGLGARGLACSDRRTLLRSCRRRRRTLRSAGDFGKGKVGSASLAVLSVSNSLVLLLLLLLLLETSGGGRQPQW